MYRVSLKRAIEQQRPCSKHQNNHYTNIIRLGKGSSVQPYLTVVDQVIRTITEKE